MMRLSSMKGQQRCAASLYAERRFAGAAQPHEREPAALDRGARSAAARRSIMSTIAGSSESGMRGDQRFE
jgi:hypothetical protein